MPPASAGHRSVLRSVWKARGAWRQLPMKLDRHQIGSAGELIDRTKCRQTAHRRQLPVGVDQVLVGDQSAVRSDAAGLAMSRPILGDKG